MELGLSPNEIEAYLVCLELGESTANRISDIANLPRSTTYDTLVSLKNMGLVSIITIKNKTHFTANDPKVILSSLEDKISVAKRVIAELSRFKNKIVDKPKAEVFQGKIAVIKLLDEIIEKKEPILVMGNQGNALEKIEYHPEKFRTKRVENKIHLRQILEVSEESKKVKEDKYTDVKFLSSLNDLKEVIFIVEDSVYHIILQYEIMAIKITSHDHSLLTKAIFEELWKIAKK